MRKYDNKDGKRGTSPLFNMANVVLGNETKKDLFIVSSRTSNKGWEATGFSHEVTNSSTVSPNLPRVYIRLCKHGNHFTFLQSEDVLSAGEQEQQMSNITPVRRYFKQGSVSKWIQTADKTASSAESIPEYQISEEE